MSAPQINSVHRNREVIGSGVRCADRIEPHPSRQFMGQNRNPKPQTPYPQPISTS